MKAKRWIVREHDAERAASLARVLGVSPILAALLINRGYVDERAATSGLAPSVDWVLMLKTLPNRKVDVNDGPGVSLALPSRNWSYPTASPGPSAGIPPG